MKIDRIVFRGLTTVLLFWMALPTTAAEKADKKLGWKSTAEVSFVKTSGNSESTTLGLSGSTQRTWKKALLGIKLGAVRVETTSDIGVAIGTPTSFTIPEVTAITAENYYAAGKYDQNITPRLFWYAAAGWLRNEFAGIENRVTLSAGIGNDWYDRPKLSFRTSYGLSNTDQRDVVAVPNVKTSYIGFQFVSRLRVLFGQKSEYGNDFVFNYSFADSDNWRWFMDQWITTSLTEKLGLKVNLNAQYNNVPAFRELTLLEGAPPSDMGNKVLVQLGELDTILGVALVVNF